MYETELSINMYVCVCMCMCVCVCVFARVCARMCACVSLRSHCVFPQSSESSAAVWMQEVNVC